MGAVIDAALQNINKNVPVPAFADGANLVRRVLQTEQGRATRL